MSTDTLTTTTTDATPESKYPRVEPQVQWLVNEPTVTEPITLSKKSESSLDVSGKKQGIIDPDVTRLVKKFKEIGIEGHTHEIQIKEIIELFKSKNFSDKKFGMDDFVSHVLFMEIRESEVGYLVKELEFYSPGISKMENFRTRVWVLKQLHESKITSSRQLDFIYEQFVTSYSTFIETPKTTTISVKEALELVLSAADKDVVERLYNKFCRVLLKTDKKLREQIREQVAIYALKHSNVWIDAFVYNEIYVTEVGREIKWSAEAFTRNNSSLSNVENVERRYKAANDLYNLRELVAKGVNHREFILAVINL